MISQLIAASKAELDKQAEELQRESLRFGLNINAEKIQAMVINRNGEQPISVKSKKIKVVEQFKYLGSMIKMMVTVFMRLKQELLLLEIRLYN